MPRFIVAGVAKPWRVVQLKIDIVMAQLSVLKWRLYKRRFVDDLDRCKDSLSVEVLQAVGAWDHGRLGTRGTVPLDTTYNDNVQFPVQGKRFWLVIVIRVHVCVRVRA